MALTDCYPLLATHFREGSMKSVAIVLFLNFAFALTALSATQRAFQGTVESAAQSAAESTFQVPADRAPIQDPKYFKVVKLEVRAVQSSALEGSIGSGLETNCNASPSPGTFKNNLLIGFDDLAYRIEQIMNIGSRVWDVIQQNKAVVNLKNDAGTALPAGAKCWLELQSWSRPQTKAFTASLKNAYGLEVVKFKYKVIYVTGGNVNGRGRYIGFATIQPVETKVAWGFKFNAQGMVLAVMNTGTHNDPIAGMMLSVVYATESSVSNHTYAQNYFIDGTGKFEITK